MCKKVKKKKKEKKILWDVLNCDFPISGDKNGGKSNGFVFFRKGRGKM